MNRHLFAITALSGTLSGCGPDGNSAAPPVSDAPGAATAASPYVDQPRPGLTPERFAPGLVSTDAIELNGVFSPDLRELYFTRVVAVIDQLQIDAYVSDLINNAVLKIK